MPESKGTAFSGKAESRIVSLALPSRSGRAQVHLPGRASGSRRLLRDLREQAGLTQADLAPLLGRPQNRVSDFERGGCRVDVIEFIDYCDAVGKDPVAVFKTLRKRLAIRASND